MSEVLVNVAHLKPYPEYQKSGLSWLARIPNGWRVVRNGSLFSQRNDTGFAELPILEVSLRTGVRIRDFGSSARKQVMSDAGKYKRAVRGDLAYNMMRMWQGAVGTAPVDGLVSPAYVVARPFPGVESRFFVDLFRTDDYMAEIDNASHGIVKDRNRLYWDQFKQILSPCPPPQEQVAIVRFLDWANGRLERAIRAKRKMIALLNEQKQAIIHRAITHGLDSSAALVAPDSLWFPQLPGHWEAVTLRRVVKSAIDGPHFSPQYHDSGIPFLSARNIRQDRWVLETAKYINEEDYLEFSKRVRPDIGDVLYTKGGTTGVARVVDLSFKFQVWVHIAVLKVERSRIVPEYLAYCLNSPRCYEQSQLFTRGATNQDLGLGRMKEIELPLPSSLSEQEAIVQFLDGRCGHFNLAVSRLEREIECLREYRARLIADVVTGKLDVREAAARLPDGQAVKIAADVELDDELEASDEEAAA